MGSPGLISTQPFGSVQVYCGFFWHAASTMDASTNNNTVTNNRRPSRPYLEGPQIPLPMGPQPQGPVRTPRLFGTISTQNPAEGVTMAAQPVRLEVITPLLTFFQH